MIPKSRLTKKQGKLIVEAYKAEQVSLENKREEEIDPVFKRIKDRYELEKAYDTGREALELDLDKVALSMFDKNERPELVKERLVTMYDTKERTNLLNENLHKAAFNTKRDKKGMPIWFQ